MRSELDRRDARVHRCSGCGTWRYGLTPCTTPHCSSTGQRHRPEHETQAA